MDYHDTVLSLGRAKEAALYFEHVITMTVLTETALARMPAAPLLAEDANSVLTGLTPLTPLALASNKSFVTRYAELLPQLDMWMWKVLCSGGQPAPMLPACMTTDDYAHLEETVPRALRDFIQDFGLREVPLIMPDILSVESHSGDEVAMTLANLHLVDTSRTSWEQITEFRRDQASRTKLRRLRVFAADSYAGRSRAYVEDDLLLRLDDYDETVRRWGFETRRAALSMLLNSKNLLGASAALLSVLFGAPPTVAGVGVAVGAVAEVGRIAVEVSRRKFALRNALRDNPVSYIADARRRLAPRSGR